MAGQEQVERKWGDVSSGREHNTVKENTGERLLIGRKEHWKEGKKENRGLISQERKGLESKKWMNKNFCLSQIYTKLIRVFTWKFYLKCYKTWIFCKCRSMKFPMSCTAPYSCFRYQLVGQVYYGRKQVAVLHFWKGLTFPKYCRKCLSKADSTMLLLLPFGFGKYSSCWASWLEFLGYEVTSEWKRKVSQGNDVSRMWEHTIHMSCNMSLPVFLRVHML